MSAWITSPAFALVALVGCGPITVSLRPPVWSRDLRGPLAPAWQSYIDNFPYEQAGIAIGNDGLIAGYDGLHLIDSVTGRDRWVTSLSDGRVLATVVSGSKILVLFELAMPAPSRLNNFRFARIDPGSGAKLWSIDVTDNVDPVSLEADAAGFSYAAVDNHDFEEFKQIRGGGNSVLHPHVVRANWDDGIAVWTRPLPEITGRDNPVHAIRVTLAATSTLLVHTTFLYDGGGLDAFAADAGTELWQVDNLSGPELDNRVILPLDNGQVLLTWPTSFGTAYQLRRVDSGATVASGNLTGLGAPDAQYADFTVTGHLLYAWSESNRILSATDLNRKEELWKVKTDGSDNADDQHPTRRLSLQAGTLYVGSNDGRIYAVNPQDGHILWRVAVPGGIRGPRRSPVVFKHHFVLDVGTGVSAYTVPDSGR
jgi:outer membrane protein assembly factor BamB